jgi:hypothetical protein
VICLAIFSGYSIGNYLCEECPVIRPTQIDRGVIKPILELATVQYGAPATTKLKVPANGKFWQKVGSFIESLGGRKDADYTFRYYTTYKFGFNLKKHHWGIKYDKGKIKVLLPEVEMLGCPAINTQTLTVDIKKSLVVLGEKKKVIKYINILTEDSIKKGEAYLKQQKDEVMNIADKQLKSFFVTMGDLLGREISVNDIEITYIKPVGPSPFDDSDNVSKAKYYGCV